jgi:hypothetical protein
MVRFFVALFALASFTGAMQYAVKERPWNDLIEQLEAPSSPVAELTPPQLPEPPRPPEPPKAPKPRLETRVVPVSREVLRYDCSGRAYTTRVTEYQEVRVLVTR